jgi:GDPmannose 4,6-dehydratase
MKINNIYYRKDISHAGNIVEGIYKLVQNKKPYDVVIGSGNFVSIKDIINFFTKRLSLNTIWIRNGKKIYLKNQKNQNILFYSQSGKKINNVLVANPKVLKKISNWKPKSNIKKIINELV